jgi:hypothetical protein
MKKIDYIDIKRKDVRGKFKVNIDLRKLRGSTPIELRLDRLNKE